MSGLLEALSRWLRGPLVSSLLRRLGIDPKQYWLLIDLFGELSERGEMLDQLGLNGVALATVAWLFVFCSVGLALLLLLIEPRQRFISSSF